MTLRGTGVTLGSVVCLLLAGCSASGPTSRPARRIATGSPGPAAARCAWIPVDPGASAVDVGTPPTTGIPTSGTWTMTIAFGQGTVTVKLDPSKAPCTTASFAYLAGKHFFDNVPCHRLTDTLLQCGDPTGTGTGGPAYRYASENVPVGTNGIAQYLPGMVGVAHSSQPDSNGSQFFLIFKDAQFPADYPNLGTVVGGLDTLRQIGAVGHDGTDAAGGGRPKQEVRIRSLTITAG